MKGLPISLNITLAMDMEAMDQRADSLHDVLIFSNFSNFSNSNITIASAFSLLSDKDRQN